MLRPPESDSVVEPAIDALKGCNGSGLPSYLQSAPLAHLRQNLHRLNEQHLQELEGIIGKEVVEELRSKIASNVIRVVLP